MPPQRSSCHGGCQRGQVSYNLYFLQKISLHFAMFSTPTMYFQTELAGRHTHNRATFEASPDAHNLHQLCRSDHTGCGRRLSISAHVLGISFLKEYWEGVRSLFTESLLQGTIPPPLLIDSVKRFLTSPIISSHAEAM